MVQGGVGSQAYMRCFSGHEHSSAHFVGMIHSVSPNSTLTIDVVGETDDFVAVKTQSSMFADMYIEKVDTNHGLASLSAVNPSSGTNWNASTSGLDLNWDQQSTIDSSFYTHSTTTNSHQITFAKSGDYLLFYNDHLDKTSSSRTNVRVRLLVNGSAETSAQCLTHYARDTQSHDESSCAMGVLLKGISAGDNVSFELLREANSGTVLAKSRALLTVIRR